MKIWIARDNAYSDDKDFDLEHFLERHPESETEFGKLHLFYDKPIFVESSWCHYAWEGGRVSADIPSYMFPNIKCGECLEFSAPDDELPEYWNRGNGIIINEQLKLQKKVEEVENASDNTYLNNIR